MADVHAFAVRVDGVGADIDVLKEVDIADGLVGRQRPDHFRDVGDDHWLLDDHLLFRPVLRQRVLDRLLAERDPAVFSGGPASGVRCVLRRPGLRSEGLRSETQCGHLTRL